jgi:multiple sugar transport system permease protein
MVRSKAMTILQSTNTKKFHFSFKWLIYIILLLGALSMLIPFLWSIATSFKLPAEVFTTPAYYIGWPLNLAAYKDMLERLPFLTYAFNTIKVSGLITIGQLITCSLAGYAFAKIKFPGKNFIFMLFLATMMVPSAVTMIPNYITMSKLKLVDHLSGLILPFIGSAYGTFLMRQFFLSFPTELEDSAKLDGCNPLMFFWYILLPNSKPIMATLGLMTFQWAWNEFQWALIMIRTDTNRTLQVGLSALQNEHYINWPLLMSASVLTNLPIIILFIFAQKQFIESIKLTGVKG